VQECHITQVLRHTCGLVSVQSVELPAACHIKYTVVDSCNVL